MIDRQHLMAVREVARAGGVSAAAERLNLSQSAVSHSIAKLEDRLQVKIWQKEGRRGALRIGMECHPCEKWPMQVAGPYLTEWPDVDLELRTDFTFDWVAALASARRDRIYGSDASACCCRTRRFGFA